MAHVSLSHRSVICRLHQRITLTVTEHMQMSTRRRKAGRGRKDGEKTDEKKKKDKLYVWWADGIREQSCYIVG